MSNNTLDQIGNELKAATSVLLFPHVSMDGDAMGSAVALCIALRKMGKQCHILLEDDIPRNLLFMEKDYCTTDKNVIVNPDLCVCVDCGDTNRFEKREFKFSSGRLTMCLDHHRTSNEFCNFNYIDSDAAATGIIIYRLLKKMGIEVDTEMAEALFAAITTDTGNFQYSNTNRECHEIIADLYDCGLDSNKVSVELYENVPLERITIENKALATLCMVAGGKGAIAYVTRQMAEECSAPMSETENIVQIMRSISGVEIAVFLKEKEPDKIKISMRAKRLGDVAAIAEKYQGGGHTKAAGCTINGSITEAFEIMKNEIEKSLENL